MGPTAPAGGGGRRFSGALRSFSYAGRHICIVTDFIVENFTLLSCSPAAVRGIPLSIRHPRIWHARCSHRPGPITFGKEDIGVNNGDTAWLFVSAALVMIMTPALAMFYGGMVRRKNILGTIMQSFIVIALISVEWMLVGYSAAFGPDLGGGE